MNYFYRFSRIEFWWQPIKFICIIFHHPSCRLFIFLYYCCCLIYIYQPPITTAVPATISGVEKHLEACALSQLEIENAQFQAGASSLVKMVQNVQAVSRVLEKLHLPGYQKPTASTTRHIFSDNTAITVGQVLQHFNWTVATYQKKATAYRWATEASSWTYTKGVPGM